MSYDIRDRDEQATETVWQRKLPRRRLLGGMLVGTAGLSIPGLLSSRAAAGTRVNGRSVGILPDQDAKQAAYVAAGGKGMTAAQARASTPDGFLPNSIAGVFASAAPGSMVLIAGPDQKAVTVGVHPAAPVWVGAVPAQGDVSACRPGDLVFAATSFGPLGGRIASFVEVNSSAYWATVTGVAGRRLSCRTVARTNKPSTDIEIEMTPATVAENGVPVVGDGIYCVATQATPTNPKVIWARFIETFDQPGWN
jgi:hypothetical protein